MTQRPTDWIDAEFEVIDPGPRPEPQPGGLKLRLLELLLRVLEDDRTYTYIGLAVALPFAWWLRVELTAWLTANWPWS